MTKLWDLFTEQDLKEAIRNELVVKNDHPTLPYSILCYTIKAQYENIWNPVTTACRGLIVDSDMNLIARPFPKFFNYGQGESSFKEGSEEIFSLEITDKLDGSLGIIYTTPDGVGVATKKSFNSPEAQKAESIIRSKYPLFIPEPGVTYLVEIISKINRIVVDYNGVEDLYLLAIIENESGKYLQFPGRWPGPVVASMKVDDTLESINSKTRSGIVTLNTIEKSSINEGLVVRINNKHLVKMKNDEYVRLHGMKDHLTFQRLYEYYVVLRFGEHLATKDIMKIVGMSEGGVRQIVDRYSSIDDFLSNIPDELVADAKAYMSDLGDIADKKIESFKASIAVAKERGMTKKEVAQSDLENKSAIFAALDEKGYNEKRIEILAFAGLKPYGAEAILGYAAGEIKGPTLSKQLDVLPPARGVKL